MIAVLWLACGAPSPTTPAGPLLRSGALPLPEGVVRPPSLEETRSEGAICGVPNADPAEVAVVVRWFRHGADRVLAEVDVDLTGPSAGLAVTAAIEPTPASLSLEPGAPWDGVAQVNLRCDRETFAVSHHGADFLQISADGVIPRP